MMKGTPIATEKDIEELAITLGAAMARTVPPAKWHEFIAIVISKIRKDATYGVYKKEWNKFVKNLTHTINDYA